MKVSFPLSLKITLWLLLNLALIAVVVLGLLVAQSGLGWEALARGATGRHAQELGNTVVADYFAAGTGAAARAAVLERARASHGATFFVFHPTVPGVSDLDAVPPEVVRHVSVRPPPGGGRSPAERGGGARKEGPARKEGLPREGPSLDGADSAPPPRRNAAPTSGPDRPDDARRADESRGRFLVRAGAPPAFWLGVRVTGDFRSPATLVARADSWWALMRLLDLQPWLLGGTAIAALTVLFWLPFVRGMTRALGQLTTATGAIAEGKFDTRVPAARRDEIGALGGSVNRMAAQLDTLVNGQKRFLADIAHELGSPIGRLQVATEILESRADPALRAHVADVREEVQQMSALVHELLAFTKAGLRPRDAELQSVALPGLVHDALIREHADSRITVVVAADLAVRADPALLERAVGNLVRNALRYTAPTDQIRVVATREGAFVHLAIEDDGPGVPAASLARLGEPFYRPDAARTREAGGTGLGLAIVVSSVVACGGEVRFSNRTPRGFRADLRLAAV